MGNDHFEPPLASLSLTHVYYNPEDPVSLICAWLALLPQALLVSYTTLTISHRELEIFLTFAGQLACEAVNWSLKRYFKQSRPREMHGKGYGMPSSHAQFMGFFAGYLALWVHLRGARAVSTWWVRWAGTLGTAAMSVLVAASRVYLSYHTPGQVACGYSVGVVFAGLWYWFTGWLRVTDVGGKGGIWEGVTRGKRVWELLLWVGEWAYVKDLCTQVDVVRWEWEVWRRYEGVVRVEGAVGLLREERDSKRE